MPNVTLGCSPQFRLRDSDTGAPVPVKGTKTKGLIALLAYAPNQTRSRAWIKKHLWSDRSEEQASGSLRQCISDIKKSVGDYKDFLKTEGANLSLDGLLFSFESCADETGAAGGTELLEDLDAIKDPQFKRWLSSLREDQAKFEEVSQAIAPPTQDKSVDDRFLVVFDKRFGGGLHENVLGSELLTSISKFLLEMPEIQVIDAASLKENPLTHKQVRGCHITIQTLGNAESVFIVAGLESLVDRRMLWTEKLLMPVREDFGLQSFELLSFTGSVVNQFNEYVKNSQEWVDAQSLTSQLFSKAVAGIFSLNKSEMKNADAVLTNIYEANPAGQILAWRAFLRSLAVFQHRDVNFLDSDISSAQLADEALKEAPSDSVSLLVTSQFEYLHRGNSEASLRFAKQSVQKNPLNALAWAVLSNTQLVGGHNDDAVVSAKRALALGAESPYRHYLEFFACMALSAVKEYEQACVHAEIAQTYSKSFTAPLRYLLPLYKATNQDEKFASSLKRLQALEPDFAITRYSDADYPVNTLRKIELIDFVT